MESEGDGLLLFDHYGVAEAFDLVDNPEREGLGPGDLGEQFGCGAHGVDCAVAVDIADANGDRHGVLRWGPEAPVGFRLRSG